MGDRLWTGKPSLYVTSQLGQLSLSSLRVDKSSTNLPGWGEGGAVTSVGWQITLCDPIDKWRPVVLRWISRRTIRSFTFIRLTLTHYHCVYFSLYFWHQFAYKSPTHLGARRESLANVFLVRLYNFGVISIWLVCNFKGAIVKLLFRSRV